LAQQAPAYRRATSFDGRKWRNFGGNIFYYSRAKISMMANAIQSWLEKAMATRGMQAQRIPTTVVQYSPSSLVVGPGKSGCTSVWQTPMW
jgi:hypothetical protein